MIRVCKLNLISLKVYKTCMRGMVGSISSTLNCEKNVEITKPCVNNCGWTSNAIPSLATRNGDTKEIFAVGFQIYDGFLRRRYFSLNLSPLRPCTALKIPDHIVGKILSWIVLNRSPLNLAKRKGNNVYPSVHFTSVCFSSIPK